MQLGQRIKEARLAAGLSQRQLCGEEITRNMLSQIENGTAKPSMSTLQYLAARLEKPISYFLNETTASPNQTRMEAARAAFAENDPRSTLAHLEDYSAPDPIFDGEKYLLEALCCIYLAESAPNAALLEQAAEAGARTLYYTPDLERRRLLCLAMVENTSPSAIAALLPDDRELLLRAEAALEENKPDQCVLLLEASRDHEAAEWLLLRAKAAFAAEDYATAAQYFAHTDSPAVYPQLEQCYLKLEDYKMAYHYACLQR